MSKNVPKNAEKFLGSEVKRWAKSSFIKQFKERFDNAEEIYEHYNSSKKKKEEDK